MSIQDPVTVAPPSLENVRTLPGTSGCSRGGELLPVAITVRGEKTAVADIWTKTAASQRHALQDGVVVATFSDGGCIVAVADATTRAIGVAPEDAMEVVLQALVEQLDRGESPAVLGALREVDAALRLWLNERPGAVVGVAITIACINSKGHAQLASVGDTRAIRIERRFARGPRIISFNPAGSDPAEGNRLRSALASPKGLAIVTAATQLRRGDLLCLASDGGLPDHDDSDVIRAFATYVSSRGRGLVTLAQLGQWLDSHARRASSYDDDRSMLLYEQL